MPLLTCGQCNQSRIVLNDYPRFTLGSKLRNYGNLHGKEGWMVVVVTNVKRNSFSRYHFSTTLIKSEITLT